MIELKQITIATVIALAIASVFALARHASAIEILIIWIAAISIIAIITFVVWRVTR